MGECYMGMGEYDRGLGPKTLPKERVHKQGCPG